MSWIEDWQLWSVRSSSKRSLAVTTGILHSNSPGGSDQKIESGKSPEIPIVNGDVRNSIAVEKASSAFVRRFRPIPAASEPMHFGEYEYRLQVWTEFRSVEALNFSLV